MATAAKLITVAEFLERPEPAGGYEELRQGEIFMVAWPKQPHSSLQHRIRVALERALGDAVIVDKEMAFRARLPSAPQLAHARLGAAFANRVMVCARETCPVNGRDRLPRGV